MQERSRGSKRFELGDVPTRASIYQEDHTPAHWPPPNARRAALQEKPRTPRNGLIASQLGLQHYPPDQWQTQAAADGDRPLDDNNYHDAAGSGEQGALAGYANHGFGEEGSYGEDAELQAALDLDNSQGLYDEQFGAYYAAATPAIDLQLPPLAAQHDYRAYAQAYAEPWHQEDYTRPGHHKLAAQPGPTGNYPFAQVARQSSQPSAAKWQAQQPIQRVASTTAARAPRTQAQVAHSVHRQNPHAPAAMLRPVQTRANPQIANAPVQHARATRANAGQPRPGTGGSQQLNRNVNAQARNAPAQLNRTANAQLNRTANAQLNRTANAQLKRSVATRPAVQSFIDDEPIRYPKPRRSGWLKRFAFAICIAAGAYAARAQIAPALLTTPAPRPQPTPVAPPAPVIPEPPPAAAAPEPVAAPAPEAPAPPEDAKARRSAARAAIITDRWRERRAARRPQSGHDDDSAPRDQTDSTASAPIQTTHYAPKPTAQPGLLRINSRPWSNVFVDGQPVGHTPQMNLRLPAGQHQITLINNEMQLRKAINVTITPGETTTQTVNLAE